MRFVSPKNLPAEVSILLGLLREKEAGRIGAMLRRRRVSLSNPRLMSEQRFVETHRASFWLLFARVIKATIEDGLVMDVHGGVVSR